MIGVGFRKEWLNKFSWLEYNEDEGMISYAVHKQFPNMADKSSSFYRGNKSSHVSNNKRDMTKTVDIYVELKTKNQQTEGALIPFGIRNLNEETLNVLEKLFSIAYYIAMTDKPSSDFNQFGGK